VLLSEQVANNVFKRFRGQPSSNKQLAQELDLCQQAFLAPLHALQVMWMGLVAQARALAPPVLV
jgi:exportin-2 (importin alpha re-exporter)